MKKLVYFVLVIIASTTLTCKLSAQNPIPSFNVPVIADPTTFEENPVANFLFGANVLSREERQIYIITSNRTPETTAWVVIEIYSLDGTITYSSFYVAEGDLFEQVVDGERNWGIRVLDASSESTMDVWIE